MMKARSYERMRKAQYIIKYRRYTRRGATLNTKECFTPEENNPYPLCIGKDKPECVNCQLRADWEPEDKE